MRWWQHPKCVSFDLHTFHLCFCVKLFSECEIEVQDHPKGYKWSIIKLLWWGYLSYLTRVFQLYFWRCGWTELKYSRYYSISFYTLKFRAFIFRSRLSLKNVILNYLAFKLLLFGKHIQNLLSFQNTDRDQIPCVCLLSVINTDMILKILIFNKYIRIVL